MTAYKIFRVSTWWSTTALMRRTENTLSIIEEQGHEIVTVAFGVDILMRPTAFITIRIKA
ncbi:MAG: hypothetical protein ACOVQ4_03840 [Flectobacillus sp.]|uniref:hypothetical protein n=1 Tax=Flectobacillus sp. TaxID=50419 RepID=UPI003B9C95AA